MTEQEKILITKLHNNGKSYSDISSELNISRNTIASFLRRNHESIHKAVCKNCGCQMETRKGKQIKLFCSDKCRFAWWNKNKQLMNTKMNRYICENCNKPFTSYSTRNKRFCCRKCYLENIGGKNGSN